MEDVDATEPLSYSLRLRRETSSARLWFSNNWQKLWFRRAAYVLGGLFFAWLLLWLIFARNLPSADSLLTYRPPLPT